MGRVLVFLSLIFCVRALGAQPSPVPSIGANAYGTNAAQINLSPGNFGGTGNTAWFAISAAEWGTGQGAGNYSPFMKNGAPWIVTTGKSGFCTGFIATAGATNDSYQLVEAGAQFNLNVASITPAPFPGHTWQSGNPGHYPETVPGTAGSWQAIPTSYIFDSATWPGVQTQTAATYSIKAMCFEQ